MGPGERQPHEHDSERSVSEPVDTPDSAAATTTPAAATPAVTTTPVDTPVDTPPPAASPVVAETGAQRFARGAHRTLLYFYVVATLVVLIFLIALVVANTSVVKVSWLFGSSSVSLVWLVMGSAILGLFLGMLVGALLRHRTRPPGRAG
jgi:uncharacterized integral membrane protein